MPLAIFDDAALSSAVNGLLIFGIWLTAALLVRFTLTRWLVRLLVSKNSGAVDVLAGALAAPLFIIIVAQGIFLGLQSAEQLDPWRAAIRHAWLSTVLALAFIVVHRIADSFLTLFERDPSKRSRVPIDTRLVPVFRRFLKITMFIFAGLLIMDNIGLSISPLLAGLGLSGLAVALALQPTLSNLFAGGFILADGNIRPGDFIELQNGPSGTVLDVSWRTTRIQTSTNNLVLVPNGTLVNSIVTNYARPSLEMNAVVECGVSYDSDLAKVEKVSLEIAREIRDELPDDVVVKSFDPLLRYRAFGDSNITFIVIMRGTSRGSTFALTHELIRRIHARFAKEGIEINYPVRKLVFPPQNGTISHAQVQGSLDNMTLGEPGDGRN